MLYTAEIRWFMPGRPPSTVLAWFGGPTVAREPARVDRYLALPEAEGVGVKLRQGLLEIKARRGPGREVAPLADAHGRLERWVKVSNPVAGRTLERRPAELALTADHSYGYPAWLARVGGIEASCP